MQNSRGHLKIRFSESFENIPRKSFIVKFVLVKSGFAANVFGDSSENIYTNYSLEHL